MHSTDNERKSVIAEKLIRTLQNRIYKYTTSVLKNVYNDKLDDIVNKCNDIYHSTIKMKPVDILGLINNIEEYQKIYNNT